MDTRLSYLVDPEVMGALIEKKLVDAMKFAPLCTVDTTLEGVPGSTIYLPSYSYIGDGVVLGEGSTLSTASLNASTVSAQIHKIAQGVTLTDEAVLSGYGDPMGEAVNQIVLALASKSDNEFLMFLMLSMEQCFMKHHLQLPLLQIQISQMLLSYLVKISMVSRLLLFPPLFTHQ